MGNPDMPKREVLGTDGDDVIVTNGSERIDANGGNDTICATGGGKPSIGGGAGDDVVDGTGQDTSVISLGGGDDTYYGGRWPDWVFTDERYPAADSAGPGNDTVHTFGGRDLVTSGVDGYQDQDLVKLGDGDDYVKVRGTSTGMVFGANGRDTINYRGPSSSRINMNLVSGSVYSEGTTMILRFSRIENAILSASGWARLSGGSTANKLVLQACQGRVDGRSGEDRLKVRSNVKFCTDLVGVKGVQLYGGRDDDTMIGSAWRDQLLGGEGSDVADGRQGRDLCRAEHRRNCEGSSTP